MKKTPKLNLQKLPPFSGLSQNGRNYIQRHYRWVEFPKQTVLIREGIRGNLMVIVGCGQVEVSYPNGKTQTLHPGESMGEGMLRYGVPSSFSARAKTNVSLWVIKRHHWLVANSISVENEPISKKIPISPHVPLSVKVAFLSVLLVLYYLGPQLPQFTTAQLKDVVRDTDYPGTVVEILSWMLVLKPDSAQTQEALGYSLFLQGESTEAIKAFNEAITLDPYSATAQNNLGVVLTNPSQASDAIEQLLIALELDPGNAVFYFNLGNAYFTNGDSKKAAESYQHASDLDPSLVEAKAVLAGIALENGELEKAGAAWLEVLESKPDHPYANKGLGVVRVLEGRFDQALPYLEKALEIDFQDDRIRYYLGLALYALGNPEEAAEEFEKLKKVSSEIAVIDLASNQLRLMEP